MRRYLLSLALAGSLSGTVGASVLGVADSAGPFTVERDGEVLRSSLGSAAVRPGDRVVAGQEQVKLQSTSGAVMIVGRKSEVVVGEDSVEVSRGSLLMHPATQGEPTALKMDSMTVTPAEGADAPKLLMVESLDGERFRVRQVGGSYTVRDATGASTVVSSEGASTRVFGLQEGGLVVAEEAAPGSTGTPAPGTEDPGLSAVAFFDFPGDDDLEISTSGEDVGGRSMLGSFQPRDPIGNSTAATQGMRD